jgi:hypothetical protein
MAGVVGSHHELEAGLSARAYVLEASRASLYRTFTKSTKYSRSSGLIAMILAGT